MDIFGYARTSPCQQSLGAQVAALESAGVDPSRIFTDQSASSHAGRDGLHLLQAATHQGDTVVVTKLDRLGRTIGDLIERITTFDARGVTLRFLDDDLSTEGRAAKMIVSVLSAVERAERQRIHERTSEGRMEAKEKGVKFGRKPTIDRDRVQTLRILGFGAATIARQMNIGRSTVYKILQSLSKNEQIQR